MSAATTPAHGPTRGRPAGSTSPAARRAAVSLRLSREQLAAVDRSAAAAGLVRADWLREAIVSAVAPDRPWKHADLQRRWSAAHGIDLDGEGPRRHTRAWRDGGDEYLLVGGWVHGEADPARRAWAASRLAAYRAEEVERWLLSDRTGQMTTATGDGTPGGLLFATGLAARCYAAERVVLVDDAGPILSGDELVLLDAMLQREAEPAEYGAWDAKLIFLWPDG